MSIDYPLSIVYHSIDKDKIMTKLKIDLKSGTLEVEGEESFVRGVYQDFKDQIKQEYVPPVEKDRQIDSAIDVAPQKHRVKHSTPKTGGKRKESYQIVKDLDLSAKSGKESLKDFYKKKAPTTAMQNAAVFIYYLERVRGFKNIGANHIYTCYKDVGEKVPGALRQSLLDASSKKGWLETKSMENITVSTQGENLVEHELPAEKKKK